MNKARNTYLERTQGAFKAIFNLKTNVRCFFMHENEEEFLIAAFNLPVQKQDIPGFKNMILSTFSLMQMKFKNVSQSANNLILKLEPSAMQMFWKYVTETVAAAEVSNTNKKGK